jgi:hypothetical protein
MCSRRAPWLGVRLERLEPEQSVDRPARWSALRPTTPRPRDSDVKRALSSLFSKKSPGSGNTDCLQSVRRQSQEATDA